MLKKTITFEDLDGNPVSRDFYFHFSGVELSQMEAEVEGGLKAKLESIIKSKNIVDIMNTFKDIIGRAYGERSDDGVSFLKDPVKAAAFLNSDAFSELFMELARDPGKAADFIKAMMPKKVQKRVEEIGSTRVLDEGTIEPDRAPEDNPYPEDSLPKPWIAENREPTKQEIKNMSKIELQELFLRKTGSAE